MMSGYEGSASNPRILCDALNKPIGIRVFRGITYFKKKLIQSNYIIKLKDTTIGGTSHFHITRGYQKFI